jgi:hypothetical protein
MLLDRVASWYISIQKSQFGFILESLGMENVGIPTLYALWQKISSAIGYIFMALYYILWSVGIFNPFWSVVPRQIWQPCVLGR